MNTFFKLFKTVNPFKLASAGLFSSMLGYYSYQKVFNVHDHPSEQFKDELEMRRKHSNHDRDLLHNAVLFSGNANKPLAEEIANELGTKLANIHVSRFNDGEVNLQVLENIRGKDVFIIQPTCNPVNENLMELLIMISCMRRASARKINVVIPYYGYARQDRKCAPRVPISAADVAKMIETMGCDRVVAVDLHCGQIQGFFGPNVPVDNIEGSVSGTKYIKDAIKFENPLVIVSPDAGGVTRAKKFQERMCEQLGRKDITLAMIIKHRDGPGKIAEMHFVGNVENSDVIIVDDMIDTAGTLCEAAKVLKEKAKAKNVYAFASHGLFSGNALENIKKSVISKIITTNTIPAKPGESEIDKIKRISVAPLLAEAIRRIQGKQSVSSLFETQK